MAKKHPEKFINPGIIDFIKELKKRKIKLFVSSGSEQKGKGGIEEEAEILGLTPYFEAVFGYNGPISPYSKENVVRWIINKYKIENPSQILVVGDGPKEMRVGRKFGAITIGLISANVTSEILKKSGADFIVYHPAALIDCLEYIDPGQL